jgi:hypothetical protein
MAHSVSENNSSNSWLRLTDIIGDRSANPPTKGLIPVSKSTIYRLVAAGRFPAPIKPSSSISLWSNDAVKVALESWGQNDE